MASKQPAGMNGFAHANNGPVIEQNFQMNNKDQ
jgi:hypothetical protein